MLKRFSLGLATVGLTASLGAYAALPTDAAPFQVNIPNLAPGWEIAVTGLLKQPTSNDEDYAVLFTPAVVATSTSTSYAVENVDPDYYWGIGVMLGYVFPCSGNDIRASWEHLFRRTTSDTTTAAITSPQRQFVEPLFNTTFNTGFVTATGSETFEYDAVDLNAGQFVNLGTRLQTRLYVGARYAHIERDLDSYFANVTGFNNLSVNSDDSKFDGAGPQFGFDSWYHLCNCFGIVGHFTTSVLVGRVKASTSFTTPTTTTTGSVTSGLNVTSLTADDETRVVPAVDAKLGLDWTYPFSTCMCDDRSLTLELGWQVTHYVDAIDRITPLAASEDVFSVVTISSIQRETSSIGFQGPYLTLSVKI